MVRRSLTSAVITALVFAFSAAGCSQNSAGANDVAIGIDLPLSGAETSDGVPTRNGAVLAIEEAQAAHLLGAGVNIIADDLDDAVNGQHDPAQGAQNVKTFISDQRVLAMIGPFNSSVATAQIPLTNDAGLAQISASATADGLTIGPGAAAMRRSHPDRNAFFRICSTNGRQGDADARFARSLGHLRAAVIDDNETYGLGLADVFAERFAGLGGTITSHEHITSHQQDFKALLTKVAAGTPDMIFYGGTTSTGGGLVRKQMGDVGMTAVGFMGGDGISDDEFRRVTGALAEGTVFTVVAPDVEHLPAARAFVAAYRKRFGGLPGPYSANAYVAAKIELAAIAAAAHAHPGVRPDRATVLANVAATANFPSPIGPAGFDAAGDTRTPMISLYKISGGKSVFVSQAAVK